MSLTKRQLAYFEELMGDYYNYPKKISLRKAELAVREVDENIGGGKSNVMANAVENAIVKELSDDKLQFLCRTQEAIEYTFKGLNDDARKIIQCRFFENNGLNSWQTVAEICGYSVASVYRIRYTTLEVFGNRLGLCNTLD